MCVFALDSPSRGDSNEYTQHSIINITKKITLNYSKYDNACSCGIFWLGTQERVRNSRGKRAIRVRATEVLLCIHNLHSNNIVYVFIQLFWLPSYNPVLLEQWLLLSKRNEHNDEFQEDPIARAKRSRVIICTTMYREVRSNAFYISLFILEHLPCRTIIA